MYRHDLDPIALVFGAVFSVLGLAYVLGHWSWFDFGRGWILAALLIACGLAGILSSAWAARTARAVRARSNAAPD